MTPTDEKKRDLRGLAQALRRELPDVLISFDKKGLSLKSAGADARIAWDDLRFVRSLQHRRELQAAGASYVDLQAGILHVAERGFYLHTKVPLPGTHLTPQQCGLLAVVLELESRAAQRLLAGPCEKMQRHLERTLGETIQKMAVTRLRSALGALGIFGPTAAGTDFDRAMALQALRSSFHLRSIGAARGFAIPGAGVIEDLVSQLAPACVEGVSRAIRDAGAHIEQRDLVCSREAVVAIQERLGSDVGPKYAGSTVTVRTASRVSIPILVGRADRDHLNPLLSAAALANETGTLGEVGRDRWAAITRSP